MEAERNDDEAMSIDGNDIVVAEIDDDLPSIIDVQLHRRNPLIVREEIQLYRYLIPESNLADVGLDELPGLENPELWKRIASRDGQPSLPHSLQNYQSANPGFFLSSEEISQAFAASSRSESFDETSKSEKNLHVPCCCRTTRARILCTIFVTGVIITVTLAIILIALLARRSNPSNNNEQYTGLIIVGGRFSSSLGTTSSTLFKSYEKEFCTVVSTTLADAQAQYALDYASCSMNKFRNGTIVGDFTLSFTRGQDIRRLNNFLNRTLTQKRIFGAKILSIKFSLATNMSSNGTNDDDKILRYYQEQEEKLLSQIIDVPSDEQTQTIHTTIDQGLSLTITITNKTRCSQTGKNYKFILIPIIESAHSSSSPTIQVQINRQVKETNKPEASLNSDVLSSLENVSSLSSRSQISSSLETLQDDSVTKFNENRLKRTEERRKTEQMFNVLPVRRTTPMLMMMQRSTRRSASVDEHLSMKSSNSNRSNSKKFFTLLKSFL